MSHPHTKVEHYWCKLIHYTYDIISWRVCLLFGVQFTRWLINANPPPLFMNVHLMYVRDGTNPDFRASNRTRLNFNRPEWNRIFRFKRRYSSRTRLPKYNGNEHLHCIGLRISEMSIIVRVFKRSRSQNNELCRGDRRTFVSSISPRYPSPVVRRISNYPP